MTADRTILRTNYALFYAVFGVFVPFLPVILHAHGHNDAAVTTIVAMNGLASLLVPLSVTHFADKFGNARQCMLAFIVAAIVLLPLHALPHALVLTALLQFLIFAALTPLVSLMDAFSINWSRLNGANFSSIRIFGSLGFLIPTLFLTLVPVEVTTLPLLAAVLCLLLYVAVRGMPNTPIKTQTHTTLPSYEAVRAIRSPALWPIFAGMHFGDMGLTLSYVALPRILQEHGLSGSGIGVIICLGVVAEIALMPFAARLQTRFGDRVLLTVGLSAAMLRMSLLAMFPTVEVAAATAVLHAPVVLAWFVVAPVAVGSRADEATRYSLQALYNSVTYGLARIVGPLLGSLLLISTRTQGLAAQQMLLLLGVLLLGIGWMCIRRLSPLPSQKVEYERTSNRTTPH